MDVMGKKETSNSLVSHRIDSHKEKIRHINTNMYDTRLKVGGEKRRRTWVQSSTCLSSPCAQPLERGFWIDDISYPSPLGHYFPANPASVTFFKHATLSSSQGPCTFCFLALKSSSTRSLWDQLRIIYVSTQDAICPEQPSLPTLFRYALNSLSHIPHHHLTISCLLAYRLPLLV